MSCQDKVLKIPSELSKMSTMLREKLTEILDGLQKEDPKVTWYQVARLAKTNYNNLRDALNGDRPFSDNQLKDLADSALLPVDYDTLIGWKLADERTVRQLEIAAQAKRLLEAALPSTQEAVIRDEAAAKRIIRKRPAVKQFYPDGEC